MNKYCLAFALCSSTLLQAKTFTLCNYSTSPKIYVAYSTYVNKTWWVQGWRHIEQGECSAFYHEGSSFYYYAEDENESYWGGSLPHCVMNKAFKLIYGQSCDNGYYEDFEYVNTEIGLSSINLVD